MNIPIITGIITSIMNYAIVQKFGMKGGSLGKAMMHNAVMTMPVSIPAVGILVSRGEPWFWPYLISGVATSILCSVIHNRIKVYYTNKKDINKTLP